MPTEGALEVVAVVAWVGALALILLMSWPNFLSKDFPVEMSSGNENGTLVGISGFLGSFVCTSFKCTRSLPLSVAFRE